MGSPTPPAPPDVPANGLLIEGSPTSTSGASDASPTAFGALVYQLPSGATAGNLTVQVASNSATTPTANLQLCPLNSPAIPAEQGGPMNDAPAFNCTTNVTAGPSSNANSYTFNVSPLVSEGALAVAILPTSPLDRVVLAQPDTNSLPVHASTGQSSATPFPSSNPAPTSDSSPAASSPGAAAPVGETSVGASSAGTPTAGAAVTGGATATPSTGVTPALASQSPSSNTTPHSSHASSPIASQFTANTGDSPPKANPLAVGLLIAAVVIGAATWMNVGRAASRSAAERSGVTYLGAPK